MSSTLYNNKKLLLRILIFLTVAIGLCISFSHGVNATYDFPERIVRFFSMFTTQCNLLFGIAYIIPLVAKRSKLGKFFYHSTVRTAVTGYMIIVFFAYHLLLAGAWAPEGLTQVAMILLHYVTPALAMLAWLLDRPTEALPWKAASLALIFPVCYLGWTFLHGFLTNWYPYPFLQVAELGYAKVLTACAIILLGLSIVQYAMVGATKFLAK